MSADEAPFPGACDAGCAGSGTVTARVLARLRDGGTAGPGGDQLTEQERKILVLVAEGLTNRQVAEQVFLAEKTVKNYVSTILTKLGLSRRAEVVAYMARKRSHDRETWE